MTAATASGSEKTLAPASDSELLTAYRSAQRAILASVATGALDISSQREALSIMNTITRHIRSERRHLIIEL